MNTRSKVVIAVGGIAALASVVALVTSRGVKASAPNAQLADAPGTATATEPLSDPRNPDPPRKLKYLPTAVPSAWPAKAPASNSPDEASLMSKLHDLGETNPALSLQLAREGNQRFPGSEQAPERGWIVCKSLVNMRRFEEARDEAKVMVEKYPDTTWTTDVQKHLLVNPLTHPAERGYGKQSELE
jgi:hypothetical protein